MRRPSSFRIPGAGRAGLAALALALAAAVTAPAALPPPTVSVIVVKKQPVYHEDSFIGRIEAAHVVNIVARITGYLEERMFRQGAEIKKGELLYLIDPAPYQAAFDQANAEVAAAKATLDNARLTLERSAKLLHTPAGRQSTYDDDRAAAESAAAKLQSAEAQLKTAAINLSYTAIRSPIAGRIGATSVNVGNVVSPASGTLATVVSQNPMRVDFSMPTRDAIRLRERLAAEGGLDSVELRVRLPDGRMDKEVGTLDFASNRISQSTDSLAMQGTIPNPVIAGLGSPRTGNRELTSGEFVTVIIRSRKPVRKIIVPRDAVLADQAGDYVLTVGKDDKVARTDVTLAATTPATATIAGGLRVGARVIVDGIEKVHPGLRVEPRVVTPPAAPG